MIFLQILIIISLLYVIILLTYSLLRGAPFAPIGQEKIKIMLELLGEKRGKFLDIGSGDGRIVMQAAKKGYDSYGIEINPVLVFVSRRNIKRAELKNAKIIRADFWKRDFSGYEFITVWGTQHMINFLEKKLLKELKPGAKVVSNHYKFPNWKFKRTKEGIYLYEK